MASEYQKWLKLDQELGLVTDELKVFVRERQEEVRTEMLRQEAVEWKRLKMEAADKRFAAEKEKEKRETRLIAEKKEKDREAHWKRLEMEAMERRLAAEEKEKEKDR